MAFHFNPQFQIISDIHLETPLPRPSYQNFKLDLHASYLCLLGDIGLVKDDGLFLFVENLLKKTPNLTIFYLFGNHEYYQLAIEIAQAKMEDFVKQMSRNYGDRLIFLNRRRYDISRYITVLGCTLWSRIQKEQISNVGNILTDYNPTRGIQNWGPEEHIEEHCRDLEWLDNEVAEIERDKPEQQIIILTHHSPTIDSRANNPRHKTSNVSSGFVTDLSSERCWTSPLVKLWAFGHTHYSFSYREEETGKLVIANQGEYNVIGASKRPSGKVKVVEANESMWEIISIAQKPLRFNRPKTNEPKTGVQQIRSITPEKKGGWMSKLLSRWLG